jgi:hypothetical protein
MLAVCRFRLCRQRRAPCGQTQIRRYHSRVVGDHFEHRLIDTVVKGASNLQRPRCRITLTGSLSASRCPIRTGMFASIIPQVVADDDRIKLLKHAARATADRFRDLKIAARCPVVPATRSNARRFQIIANYSMSSPLRPSG